MRLWRQLDRGPPVLEHYGITAYRCTFQPAAFLITPCNHVSEKVLRSCHSFSVRSVVFGALSCVVRCRHMRRDLLRESLEENTVVVNSKSISLPMNEELWTFSDESHRILHGASLPSSCQFFKYVSCYKHTDPFTRTA